MKDETLEPATSGDAPNNRRLSVEMVVSRVLFSGGLLAITLLLIGLALYASHGSLEESGLDLRSQRADRSAAVFVSVREIGSGLAHRPIDPLAVMGLGLVVLVMTPVVGVAFAIPAFWRAGDRDYVVISAIVLAALVLSFLLAGGAG